MIHSQKPSKDKGKHGFNKDKISMTPNKDEKGN